MKYRSIIGFLTVFSTILFSSALFSPPAIAANKVLKIGVLGVMSGPAASWGLVNRYCAEARANMINAAGGFQIGNQKYDIEIISIDDRNDPKLAVSGAERLVYQEGVKYIIGPNIDTTAAAIVPVIERAGAMNIPYAFSRALYQPPRGHSILGMIASYQAGPVIYKYLKSQQGVKRVAFVARNESDSLNQRKQGIIAAQDLGMKIIGQGTYESGTIDFFPIMSRITRRKPDLIVLSGVAPSDAPNLIKSARQLNYHGLISTETAQDAKVLEEIAGADANGFISVGGASTPAIRSAFMEEFINAYIDVAGEWNDEAGTKVYALEMILHTIQQAGPAALSDVTVFQQTMPNFSMTNPFLQDGRDMKYVGGSFFRQKRQLSIPMVVNQYENGNFKTIFVGSVE